MTRCLVRLAVAIGLAAGATVASATAALADPHQVCVVYDDDRSGYCVEVDVPLSGNRLR